MKKLKTIFTIITLPFILVWFLACMTFKILTASKEELDVIDRIIKDKGNFGDK